MVKFHVETLLACDASMYIAVKDTAVYKKFHVSARRTHNTIPLSPLVTRSRGACPFRSSRADAFSSPFATTSESKKHSG
jgi:hypothetical protein